MDVSVTNAKRIQMRDGGRQLSEKTESVKHAGRSFAELLPGADVVWGFTTESNGVDVFQHLNFENVK